MADVHLGVCRELLLVGVLEEACEAAPVLHVVWEPCRSHREHVLDGGQILRHDRCHRQAALAGQLGRDALRGLEEVRIFRAKNEVAVGVGVYPAGADVLAAGVDDSGGFLTAVCHDQLSAGNTDAALIGRLSGAIDDIRILDQHIQHIICSFPFCSFSLNELLSSIGININVFSVSVNGKSAFSNAFSAFSSIFTKAGSRF